MYYFDKEELIDFKKANTKNFLLANGVGGFTAPSLIGSIYRKQNGYLISSLESPVQRKLILAKINEKVVINGTTYDLDTQEYLNGTKNGNKYLEEVLFNYIPSYQYNVLGLSIKKRVCPIYNQNGVAVSYEIFSKAESTVYLEPLFNYRDISDVSDMLDLNFEEKVKENLYTLIPSKNSDIKIKFQYSEGLLCFNENKYTNPFIYRYDLENGDDRIDYHFKPISIRIDLKPNEIKNISIICTIDKLPVFDSFGIMINYESQINKWIRQSKITDPFGKNLVVSAANFIAERKSTNAKTILAGFPWFTDWGRDTMISFTGICLVTKRFKEAKEVLKSFSYYEKNGLIPNMFPDKLGEAPYYNTVDASLWFIYASYKYIEYTKDYDFIRKEIYPTLKRIIYAYMAGTDYSIKMDKDYLISAGNSSTQITWMDVKFDGRAVTPRNGKPVEINALWYNALMIMNELSNKYLDNEFDYLSLANKVKESFRKYITKDGYLYDVIDDYDSSIRPNQLYSISLPFKLLEKEEAKKVLDIATNDLYNEIGIRSLSIKDNRFKPNYTGPLKQRDLAYHMGSSWCFLFGAYIDSYNYVYGKDNLKHMFNKFKKHLEEGSINGVAELFDGNSTYDTKGCYSQAWSVAELLRSYYENVLKNEGE